MYFYEYSYERMAWCVYKTKGMLFVTFLEKFDTKEEAIQIVELMNADNE